MTLEVSRESRNHRPLFGQLGFLNAATQIQVLPRRKTKTMHCAPSARGIACVALYFCNFLASHFLQCMPWQQTTLDLSNLHGRSNRVVINRWPYGLQGRKHGMFHITTLFIHGQELAGMPIDLYRLTNITDLRLHDNKIRWILPEICELVDLHICWLHGNLLTTLPGTIGKCSGLYHLSVAHCKLVSLPGQLGYCRRLR